MAIRIPKFLWDLFLIPKPTGQDDGKSLVWDEATSSYKYASPTAEIGIASNIDLGGVIIGNTLVGELDGTVNVKPDIVNQVVEVNNQEEYDAAVSAGAKIIIRRDLII